VVKIKRVSFTLLDHFIGQMFLFIFMFLSLFRTSLQLLCSTNCSIIQVNYSDTFIEPVCVNNTSMQVCKGRIIAYYIGKNFPKYINYTLGTTGDLLEKKNENDIYTHGLTNLTKYQVIVNAKKEETILIADVYCTVGDNCALSEIKKLFIKYKNQINPFYELKTLIYVDPPSRKLFCFDVSIDKSKQCAITNKNSVCLSYLRDLKQECSVESDVHIHEEFIVTSPETFELNLMNELVKCNKDNCNNNEVLTKIQNIARNYAYGSVIIKNNANEQQKGVNQIFFVFVLVFFSFNVNDK
jgi:hypothetical protein